MLWYAVYDGVYSQPDAEPDPQDLPPVERVAYRYDNGGNPVVVARQLAGESQAEALRFVYSAGGQVWMVMSYTWQVDPDGGIVPESVQRTAVREFRTEGVGRARYLVQDRDVDTLDVIPGSDHWTEYDGDAPYADYYLDGDVATVTKMYLPGIAEMEPGAVNPVYFHGDQIGTMRALTETGDPVPSVVGRAAYTAFGELVESTGAYATRYGYAGAWGYEEGLMPVQGSTPRFPYLHVGARWYDPLTGRFLQRDPIGIAGGLNLYAYMLNLPTMGIDSSGLGFWDGDNWFHDWIARKFWMARVNPASKRLPKMGNAEAAAWVCVYTAAGTITIYKSGKLLLRALRRPPGPGTRIRGPYRQRGTCWPTRYNKGYHPEGTWIYH